MINLDINKAEREKVAAQVKEYLESGCKIVKLASYEDKPLNTVGFEREGMR